MTANRRTATLRRQHDAALALSGELLAAIAGWSAAPPRDSVMAVTMALAKLTGLLRIHFAQEDQLLYPAMVAAGGTGALAAQAFTAEMGELGPVYAAYAERWRAVDAILASPTTFCTETRGVFTALAERIERENAVLYPLADAIDEAAKAA